MDHKFVPKDRRVRNGGTGRPPKAQRSSCTTTREGIGFPLRYFLCFDKGRRLIYSTRLIASHLPPPSFSVVVVSAVSP